MVRLPLKKTTRGDEVGQECVLCDAVQTQAVSFRDRHGRDLVTVLCAGCGVLRNDPVPDEAELQRFYSQDYRRDYKGATEPRLRQVWRNFGRLNRHFAEFADVYAQRGSWLDLGAGSGEFGYLARGIGIEITAVEPNEGYAGYCRERLGLVVTTGRLEDCDFAPACFDAIRLSHVLEHMRDPVASLRRLAGWLKPGGLLYIEVPDIESDARNKLQGRLFHYGHIYNYNPVTLRVAALRAGLVEAEATRERSAGRCGAFFTPAPVSGPALAICADALAENALRMKETFAAHAARRFPDPVTGSVLGRFIERVSARLGEARAARRMKTHRAIAESALADLRGTLLAGPV